MTSGPVFSAPWGAMLKIISAAATAVLFGGAVLGLMTAHLSVLQRVGLVGGSLMVLAGCALTVVRGYQIAPNTLLVERLLWTAQIPLEGLLAIETDVRALRGSVRIFGNGGLYSFSGWCWNRRLGRYRMLVTDWRRAVVLRFRDRCVVVSPDRPGEFVDQLKNKIAKHG